MEFVEKAWLRWHFLRSKRKRFITVFSWVHLFLLKFACFDQSGKCSESCVILSVSPLNSYFRSKWMNFSETLTQLITLSPINEKAGGARTRNLVWGEGAMDVDGLVSQGIRAFGPDIAKSILNLSGKENLEPPESAPGVGLRCNAGSGCC